MANLRFKRVILYARQHRVNSGVNETLYRLVAFLKKSPVEFYFDEFIIACALSFPITELNRYIDHRIEKKLSWTEHPRKRFATHLLLISFWLVVLLNTLGNAYMWITQKGFFSWKELIIINVVTLCLAILLTIIKWAIHFYSRWIQSETKALESERIANELKQKLTQTARIIEVQKGTAKSKVEAQAIRIAKIQLGTVRVYTKTGDGGIFPGTLSELNAQLPSHLFFQVTRDSILHREAIKSVASSTFGKIQLVVEEGYHNSNVTVSRPKAAMFRKWYNSTSA